MTTIQGTLLATIKYTLFTLALLFIVLLLLGVPRFYQTPINTFSAVQSAASPTVEDVLVRIGGDAAVAPGERMGAVLVFDGNAVVEGDVEVAVVADGTLRVRAGQVGQIFAADGRVHLEPGATVMGDIRLIDAELTQEDGAQVLGTVHRGIPSWVGGGLVLVGVLLGMGWILAVILSGVAVAAFAGSSVRHVGRRIVDETRDTLVATLVFWVGVPILAVLATLTIVGLPLGLAVLLFVLPVVSFAGYLIAGIRLGDSLVEWRRGSAEAFHPYLAALIGISVLMLISILPIIGETVSAAATLVGSGALILHLWRRMQVRATDDASAPTPSPSVAA